MSLFGNRAKEAELAFQESNRLRISAEKRLREYEKVVANMESVCIDILRRYNVEAVDEFYCQLKDSYVRSTD